VGSTKNPRKRIAEANIFDPERAYRFEDLRFFLKGYHEAEAFLHLVLADRRLDGEWFSVPPTKASSILNRLHCGRDRAEPDALRNLSVQPTPEE